MVSEGCSSRSITINADQDDYANVIRDSFVEPFYLKKATYSSDVYFQESEFLYLFDMRPGELIASGDIIKAVSYFFKKNKFQAITIKSVPQADGAQLHFEFVGSWTFIKLKLYGLMLGKDMYRQYYLLDSGEQFDQEKHDLSIEKMKEAFAAQGYFNGLIESRIERDQSVKSVIAHLSLKKGDRFSIGSVSFDMKKDESVCHEELDQLRNFLYDRFFKSMIHTNYSKRSLNDQIGLFKKYLFNKGFVHVSIELDEKINYRKKRVDLSFTVHLHRKKEFVFLGNHHFTVEELLEHIALFGRSAWLLPLPMLEHHLKELYRKKGFWSVGILSREEGSRSFFIVTEGSRLFLKRVVLQGVSSKENGTLVDRFFSPFMKKKQYNGRELELCINDLLSFYMSHGFLQAKIVSRSFNKLTDQSEGLDKNISESDPYELIITINKGERSDLARVASDLKAKTAAKEIYFGKTIITGNTTFPFDYILRELCYTQGQPWDKRLVKRSLDRLKGLEVFDSIHLYPYRSTHDDTENSMVLKLQKDDPFELRLRLGFAAQQVSKSLHTAGLTYRAGGAFLVKNPFNYGDRLLVEADVTRSSRTTLVQYRQPSFFNLPARTIFQAYSNRYEQPGLIGAVKNLYDVTQQGFLIGVSGNHDHGESSMNVGVEWMKTTVCNDLSSTVCSVDELARAINFTPRLLDKNIPYFLVEPTVLLDYVDNRLDPTRGYFTLFSCKGMVPIDRSHTDAYFVRLLVEQSFFRSIYSVVCALRIRCGHIFNQSLKNIVPIERFYLGGANSVRSYETDRCPPLGIFFDDNGRPQHVPRGGKTLLNMNLEARFSLYKNIKGVLFQDCGFLSGNFLNRSKEEMFVAGTGFGVRYSTPIGPVRFDIAWKWQRSYKEESPYAWFVTLGQAF